MEAMKSMILDIQTVLGRKDSLLTGRNKFCDVRMVPSFSTYRELVAGALSSWIYLQADGLVFMSMHPLTFFGVSLKYSN